MAIRSEDAVDTFITRWQSASGSERANYQLFVHELCTLLELPTPDPAREDRRTIGLRHIIGLPSIRPRALDVFFYALRWYEEGMDFGDALHLAMSAGNERFASFDKAMTKMAAKIGASPQVTQP